MNYVILIYNKVKCCKEFVFELFIFRLFGFPEMYLCIVGVFCIINGYFNEFNYRIRCIFLYKYEDNLKICFAFLENVPEV